MDRLRESRELEIKREKCQHEHRAGLLLRYAPQEPLIPRLNPICASETYITWSVHEFAQQRTQRIPRLKLFLLFLLILSWYCGPKLINSYKEAEVHAEQWRLSYNHKRPNGALNYQTPAAFAATRILEPPAPVPAQEYAGTTMDDSLLTCGT